MVVNGNRVILTPPSDFNASDVISTQDMSGKAVLICRQNSHPFQDRTLTLDQPVKIGRSVARARTGLNNGIFDCKVLSRNHALFWYTNGKFYLQDTKSSNGTFVNNQRLSKSGEESGPREVCSGDIVQFGVDVLENARKVTHGCIVATLKLFLPDGKEAKASPSTTVFNTTSTVPPEELYQLNQCIQSALHREEMLNTKLKSMKETIEFCRLAADKGWKALIAEDRLLSRVELLENQLEVYSQTYSEDKSRQELLELHGAKNTFEIILKDQFKKMLDEKMKFHLRCKAAERTLSSAEVEISHLNSQIAQNQEELQVLAKKLCVEVAKVDELQHSLLQVQNNNKELQQRLKADLLDDASEDVQERIGDMYHENEQNEKISTYSSSIEHTMQLILQRLSVSIAEHKKFKDNVEHTIAQINLLQTEKISILLELTDKENELIELSAEHARCQKEVQTLSTAVIDFEEGLRTDLLPSVKMEKFLMDSEVEIKTLDGSDIWDAIPEKWNADLLQSHLNKLKGSLENAQEMCSIADMKIYNVKLDIGAATDKLKETTDTCMLQQKRLEEVQALHEGKERAVLALKEQLEEKLERSSKDTIEHVRKQIGEMYLENEQSEKIFFHSSSIEHLMQVVIHRLSVSIDEHKKYKHIVEHVIAHINILQEENMSKLQEIVDQEKESEDLRFSQSINGHNIEFLSKKLIDFEHLLRDAIWAGETEKCSSHPEVEIKMVLELQEWDLVIEPGEWNTAQIQLHINKLEGSLEKERKTYVEKEIKIRNIKENISAIDVKLKETTHNCVIQEKRLEEVQMLCVEKEKAVLALKEQLNKYLEILSNLLRSESNQVEEKLESSKKVTTEQHRKIGSGDVCPNNANTKQLFSLEDIKRIVTNRLSVSIDERKKCKYIVDHIIGKIRNLHDQKHSRLQEISEKENELAEHQAPGTISICRENKRILNKNIIDFEPLFKAEILECQNVDKCSPESEDEIKTVVEPEKWDLSHVNKLKDSLEHTNEFRTAREMKVHKLKEDIGLITDQLKELTDECTIQRKRLEEAHKLYEWKEKAVLDLKLELDFLETSLEEETASSNDTTEQLRKQLLEAQQLAKQSWNEAEQARDRVKALSVKLEEQSKEESEDKLKLKQFLESQHNLVKLQDKLRAQEIKIAELEHCNQRLASELDEKTILGEHELCLNGSQIEVCALEEELILLKQRLSEIETSKSKLENELYTTQENIFSKNIVFVLPLAILIMAMIYMFFPTFTTSTGTTRSSTTNS